MQPIATLQNSRLLKIALFVAVALAAYWLLAHWDDFKEGFVAGFNGQAKPKP